MTGGNYTALHPARTPVSGKERVSLSRKTVRLRHDLVPTERHSERAAHAPERRRAAWVSGPGSRLLVRGW